MNFSFLGPFHPQIVHTPVALLIFSAIFGLVALFYDRDWLKKTSVLLLVIGFLGAWLAVQSGGPAHRVPEHEQGVPEDAIHKHSDTGKRAMNLAGGALVALAIATRFTGRMKNVLAGLALVLQIGAAMAVGFAGYLGGKLTYEHGANVKVDGELVKSAKAAEHAEREKGEEPGGGSGAR